MLGAGLGAGLRVSGGSDRGQREMRAPSTGCCREESTSGLPGMVPCLAPARKQHSGSSGIAGEINQGLLARLHPS